ncbi:XRE family transcriptional regulator [Microbacterium sp. Root53]|uniref:helix-turn-helix domain-containing protein n=1 Tax=Microbacterium sp. Root53 TaxID=1736553 RepID=UPI0007014F17|nr:helix-turn-helix transcriptional regulator [Microbacterium sp. Root53]KQY98598.1 XRE family transcriptional regulator [Microbacterium sp. Root53]
MAELLPLRKSPTVAPAEPDPLWRHLAGDRLRRMRRERGETLAEVARRAGISVQYLSEIERGRKEPSSEMVAAVLGALGGTLLDLTAGIAEDLRAAAPDRAVHGVALSAGALALAA